MVTTRSKAVKTRSNTAATGSNTEGPKRKSHQPLTLEWSQAKKRMATGLNTVKSGSNTAATGSNTTATGSNTEGRKRKRHQQWTPAWNQAKKLLDVIWARLPAMPSVQSRHVWADAHGVPKTNVTQWFTYRVNMRRAIGIDDHPETGYTLLDDVPQEEPPSSSSSPPLDSSSGPSDLMRSSSPPQTPMDLYGDLSFGLPSGASFGEAQSNFNPFSIPAGPGIYSTQVHSTGGTTIGAPSFNPFSFPSAPGIYPSQVHWTGETTIANVETNAVNGAATSSGQQEEFLPHPAGSVMFPQTLPAGYPMVFDTRAHNPSAHSFRHATSNPYTSAPLFNNAPAQFSGFPGQPSHPTFFNSNAGVNLFTQMPQDSLPGAGMNVPGPVAVDQDVFGSNFQGIQCGIPPNGDVNLQNYPEPTVSFLDLLNDFDDRQT